MLARFRCPLNPFSSQKGWHKFCELYGAPTAKCPCWRACHADAGAAPLPSTPCDVVHSPEIPYSGAASRHSLTFPASASPPYLQPLPLAPRTMSRPKRGGGAATISDVVGSADKDETGDRMRARCCMYYRDGKGGDIRCRGQVNLVPLPAAVTNYKTYQHPPPATEEQEVTPAQVVSWRTGYLAKARVTVATKADSAQAAHMCAAHIAASTTAPVGNDGARSTPLWSGRLLQPLRDARTFQAA